LVIEGFGFKSNAYVHMSFDRGGVLLENVRTDDTGSFIAQLNIPERVLCRCKINVFDDSGNSLNVPVEQCAG
jgi:hypothetical protein